MHDQDKQDNATFPTPSPSCDFRNPFSGFNPPLLQLVKPHAAQDAKSACLAEDLAGRRAPAVHALPVLLGEGLQLRTMRPRRLPSCWMQPALFPPEPVRSRADSPRPGAARGRRAAA